MQSLDSSPFSFAPRTRIYPTRERTHNYIATSESVRIVLTSLTRFLFSLSLSLHGVCCVYRLVLEVCVNLRLRLCTQSTSGRLVLMPFKRLRRIVAAYVMCVEGTVLCGRSCEWVKLNRLCVLLVLIYIS